MIYTFKQHILIFPSTPSIVCHAKINCLPARVYISQLNSVTPVLQKDNFIVIFLQKFRKIYSRVHFPRYIIGRKL